MSGMPLMSPALGPASCVSNIVITSEDIGDHVTSASNGYIRDDIIRNSVSAAASWSLFVIFISLTYITNKYNVDWWWIIHLNVQMNLESCSRNHLNILEQFQIQFTRSSIFSFNVCFNTRYLSILNLKDYYCLYCAMLLLKNVLSKVQSKFWNNHHPQCWPKPTQLSQTFIMAIYISGIPQRTS